MSFVGWINVFCGCGSKKLIVLFKQQLMSIEFEVLCRLSVG